MKHEVEQLKECVDTAALQAVHEELFRARLKFPNFNSAHEGFAILLEEVDELWDEVKRPQPKPGVTQSPTREEGLRAEAIQVAAMAIRFITDCCGK